MAHRRRSGFAKTIDFKQWDTVLQGKVGAFDIAEGTVALGPTGAAATVPLTVLRTRGQWQIELDAAAVNERVQVAAGIIITSDEAFAAGAASVPSPQNDGEDDWLWHGYLTVTALQEAAVDPSFLSASGEIDSKAMRKMNSNEIMIFVAEIVNSTDQTGTLDFQYACRQLIGT
jgi:hypothetical protein